MLTPLALLIAAAMPLTTHAERTGWRETGRYAEVEELCRAFPQAFPGRVRCEAFGVTPEGRPMLALVASDDGALDPGTAHGRGRPVVLLQGGIHAGEIDGKDAGFLLLRDLLEGRAGAGVLRKVTVVLVPVFNVDGHERFGPGQRPNQTGPEEGGFRVTAQRLNLNRDYAKADAPEMRAMLALLRRWDPILYADLHATDGARFRHGIAVMVEPALAGPEPLRALGAALRDEIQRRLAAHHALTFYPAFLDDHDPASGFAAGIPPPRFSTNFAARRNRFGVLVETHSWDPYGKRVRATRDAALAMVELAARDGQAWLAAAGAADDADRAGQGDVVLTWKRDGDPRAIEFLGYRYEKVRSEISGGTYLRYDLSRPETWKVPLWERVAADAVVTPPASYVVPAAFAGAVAERLAAHGFAFTRLARPEEREVEVYRASTTAFDPAPFEGRVRVALEGGWTREKRTLPAGSLVIPTAQRGRQLLVALLEPEAPDSLAAWGFFNACLERKEYIEDYLLEAQAPEMLRRDAALRARFEERLKDAAFAADRAARLDFLYRHHAAWDTEVNVLPVYRSATPPAP